MNIVLVGLSHRTAPVEIRERFSFPVEKMGDALYRLKSNPLIEEGIILSTCNRVEVCAVVKDTRAGLEAVKDFLIQSYSGVSRESLEPCFYMHTASNCLRHLFRVASSLDSMILGEPQILGQIKDAFDQGILHKTTGVILNKVFKKAISVAKRVRTETRIAESAVSVSYAAVELAKKIFGKLTEKSVLLIGAGEMAELAARHFKSSGVLSISFANRSYDRALELSKDLGGIPVKFEDFHVEMASSDIVLCSTGAPDYVIKSEEVSKVIGIRQNRPIFFIDISVPRNIDPKINDLDNVFLYDIDDLQISVETNIKLREKEALKAEGIITEEIERFARWFKSLDAVPMIVALKDRAEEIRIAELEKLSGRLGSLTKAQREALDGLTSAIVNKLLHSPLTVLKQEVHSTNGNMMLEATRRLFDLEEILARPEKEKKQDPEGPLT